MNNIIKVGVVFGALLLTPGVRSAQNSNEEDPCGDPVVESQSWSPVEGKVIRVVDGNTIVIMEYGVLKQVHLSGIEPPPPPGGELARASRRLLERLVNRRTVEVWLNPSKLKWTKAKRPRPHAPAEFSGVVFLRDLEMVDVNLIMVQSGMARHQSPPAYSMSNWVACHYVKAENDARVARRGMWWRRRT